MKYETFRKHTIALVEKTLEKGKKIPLYQNTEDALFFIPDIDSPYYAYRLEGMKLEQPGKSKTVDIQRVFKDDSHTYAEKQDQETEWNGKTVVHFRTEDGQREGAFDKKYVSLFPENARFYLPRSRRKPAIVGLWENDRLQIIGCVCPMNI